MLPNERCWRSYVEFDIKRTALQEDILRSLITSMIHWKGNCFILSIVYIPLENTIKKTHILINLYFIHTTHSNISWNLYFIFCFSCFLFFKQLCITNNTQIFHIFKIHSSIIHQTQLHQTQIFQEKCYIDTLHSHTSLYTLCTRKREEEIKEKMCLFGVHMVTCQIFVWVSRGVLTPKSVYVA